MVYLSLSLPELLQGFPSAIGGTLELVRTGAMHFLVALGIFLAATRSRLCCLCRARTAQDTGELRKTPGWAKGLWRTEFSSYRLKLNMAGVIPPIFASSIILFPATLAGWFASGESMSWLKDISNALSPGQPIYVMMYAAMIVFFCFFYTALVFNPKETAENLKKERRIHSRYSTRRADFPLY